MQVILHALWFGFHVVVLSALLLAMQAIKLVCLGIARSFGIRSNRPAYLSAVYSVVIMSAIALMRWFSVASAMQSNVSYVLLALVLVIETGTVMQWRTPSTIERERPIVEMVLQTGITDYVTMRQSMQADFWLRVLLIVQIPVVALMLMLAI